MREISPSSSFTSATNCWCSSLATGMTSRNPNTGPASPAPASNPGASVNVHLDQLLRHLPRRPFCGRIVPGGRPWATTRYPIIQQAVPRCGRLVARGCGGKRPAGGLHDHRDTAVNRRGFRAFMELSTAKTQMTASRTLRRDWWRTILRARPYGCQLDIYGLDHPVAGRPGFCSD